MVYWWLLEVLAWHMFYWWLLGLPDMVHGLLVAAWRTGMVHGLLVVALPNGRLASMLHGPLAGHVA